MRMTLDEVIDGFKNDLKYCDNVYDKFALQYLEELKTLRMELENNSKKSKIYKKALEYICMRCETLDRLVSEMSDFPEVVYTASQWEELALKKARKRIK